MLGIRLRGGRRLRIVAGEGTSLAIRECAAMAGRIGYKRLAARGETVLKRLEQMVVSLGNAKGGGQGYASDYKCAHLLHSYLEMPLFRRGMLLPVSGVPMNETRACAIYSKSWDSAAFASRAMPLTLRQGLAGVLGLPEAPLRLIPLDEGH